MFFLFPSTVHAVSILALNTKHHDRHSFVTASDLTCVRQGALALAFLALVHTLLRLERFVHKVIHFFHLVRHLAEGGVLVEQFATFQAGHHLRQIPLPTVQKLEQDVVVVVGLPRGFTHHLQNLFFERKFRFVVPGREHFQRVVHLR